MADPPAPSKAQYPQDPLHVSQPGADPRWARVPQPGDGATGSSSPHSTCSCRRKWPQPHRGGSRSTSCDVSALCHSAPRLSQTHRHQAASVATLKGLYVPNPYAALLWTMTSTLEKFIHSLDPRALPRVLQIQSGIYFQGEHRVLSGKALRDCL